MNIGLIAHDSKKKLMQIGVYFAKMSFMQLERPED